MDMVQPKTVVVGAGSHFTPRLVSDFILCEELSGSTVVLVDVDAVRLKIMEQLAHRMVSETGADLRLESTTRCGEALENADFVINTIAVGNHLEAWELDMEIPAKYGVYQSVGDTVGPGGLSRALRTIPVVLDICRDMEDLCPKAYLINFTNPMSCICRAVNRATKIEVIGLCHALYGALRFLARVFEADVDEVEAQAAGVNHLTWILSLRLRGRDAYPTLKERLSHPKRPDLLNRYVHS